MKEETLLAILRLQKSKSIGDILAKKLIANVGDVAQIFKEKSTTLAKINGIGSLVIRNLFDKENLESAKKELEFILENNINYSSPQYFTSPSGSVINCIFRWVGSAIMPQIGQARLQNKRGPIAAFLQKERPQMHPLHLFQVHRSFEL